MNPYFNLTGPSPLFNGSDLLKSRRFINGIDSASLGGCLDAPDFIPVGAAQCEFYISTFTRDDISDAIDVGLTVNQWNAYR
jgi:hypothetical protein